MLKKFSKMSLSSPDDYDEFDSLAVRDDGVGVPLTAASGGKAGHQFGDGAGKSKRSLLDMVLCRKKTPSVKDSLAVVGLRNALLVGKIDNFTIFYC